MTAQPKPQIKTQGGTKSGAAAAIAAAALIMAQFVPVWEGRSLTPYKDVVGVWTVCEGETRGEMRTYTAAECDAMSAEMYKEFAAHVVKVTPGIEEHPFMLAAFSSIAINIGKAGYSRSSMRREYRVGNYRQACRALLKYNKAGGRGWRGLELRRRGDADRMGEYEVCMADAVEAQLAAQGVL